MMNERIRELKEQAMRFAQEKCEGKSRDMYGALRADIMTEKFAELIVEEMYDFIMEESASDNGIPDLGKVKQHFGVER